MVDLEQIKADIAARKAMPAWGPHTSIERIRTINATLPSFSLKTVEALVEALEVNRSSPRPASTVPDCAGAEFGTYSGQIHVVTPNGRVAGIDACIFSEVLGLWEAGITTIESCCGHNKASSYIAVAEADAGKMRELGYKLDEHHPTGCVFYSKTSRHGRVTQPAPLVPEEMPSNQTGAFRENENSSTVSFREISETSTKGANQ
ncbi:hypothetical protein [Klebsiella michiganensis]|uniref:hypothetical protein n=1 Tax=Klebsiella michiganensis TaxID=1134687 RepID=UPI0027FABC2E|nr:hypothetical protein [Klebsiella michiganensis]HDT6006556.1 hypothetical protein [Klebsiella michiganensis]